MRVLILLVFLSNCLLLSAQRPGSGRSGGRSANFVGQVSGKIIDNFTKKPMEYATITAFRLRDMQLVSGTISGRNGEFLLDSLKGGMYQIRFSFIGYGDKIIDSLKITPANRNIDLGKVILSSTDNELDAVTILGDKPIVKYEIDKKVIDVSNLNTTASESAIEVLENIPSINVDVDGNVSLRGNSSFTLYIDNKPTTLDVSDALKLIPANSIQEIEIITNPSARFDAEGVSGIINIVLKKNRLNGVSALANLNAGTYNQKGADFLINMNQKKVSFTLGGNYRTSDRPKFTNSFRETMLDTVFSRIEQDGLSAWTWGGYGINGEIEWRPNRKTTVTVGGELGVRIINSSSTIDFKEYADQTLLYTYNNKELTTRNFLNYSFNSTLKHNVKGDEKHYLYFRALYNTRSGDELALTNYYDSENVIQGGNKNTEVGPSYLGRFNFDYVRPLKNGKRFETGLQAQLGLSKDQTETFYYDTTINDYASTFSTNVDYFRNIYAAYVMYAGKTKKLGYQFGFRGEYTDRTITSNSDTSIVSTYINRLDLFPSAHFSYDLNKKNQFMFNVARRIQRPRSYYFEPFITWQNAYSVRSGNANLIPEYILSTEIGWIRNLKKGSFSFEVYHRSVNNKIQRVRTVYQANVIMSQPENIGNEYSTGVEIAYTYPISKTWKMSLTGNVYNYLVTGAIENISFEQQSFSYNARFNNTFTIKGGWRIQSILKYNSPIVTPQGNKSNNYSTDLSIKKDLNKKKMSVSIQIRDVFSTSRTITEVTSVNLYTYSIREPRTPTVNVSFSMRLNNYNKRQKRQEDVDEF